MATLVRKCRAFKADLDNGYRVAIVSAVSGRRDRFNVIAWGNTARAWVVGREITLGHAKRLVAVYAERRAVR